MSRALVWTAGLAGAVPAGFSLYWAGAGCWRRSASGAVDLSTEHPRAAGITLGLVAAVKLLGATIPVGVAYGRAPWPWLWRGFSWAGGLLLVAYGGINTIVALAVLAGVIRPEGGYDADAMRGHAYLWDPLFFLWGARWFCRCGSRGRPCAPSGSGSATGRPRLAVRDDAR